MFASLVCGFLVLTGPGLREVAPDVRVTVEVINCHSKKLPAGLPDPRNIPASTKPTASLAVKATLGKPFAVEMMVGSRELRFSGVVEADSEKTFIVRVDASLNDRQRGGRQE